MNEDFYNRIFSEIPINEMTKRINNDNLGFKHFLDNVLEYNSNNLNYKELESIVQKIKTSGIEKISIEEYIKLSNTINDSDIFYDLCNSYYCNNIELRWNEQDSDGKCSICKCIEEKQRNE